LLLFPLRQAQVWGGQVIEFFDFGKADIHLRAAGIPTCLQQLRQTVQSLRAEHHIHIRRALHDGFTFLAGDTSAHADQQIRLGQLERAHAPQIREHFLLGLLADRTGIEQDDIGLFRPIGLFHTRAGTQQVRHLARVVLVHLAAIGFDIEFFGHTGILAG